MVQTEHECSAISHRHGWSFGLTDLHTGAPILASPSSGSAYANKLSAAINPRLAGGAGGLRSLRTAAPLGGLRLARPRLLEVGSTVLIVPVLIAVRWGGAATAFRLDECTAGRARAA